MGVVRARVSASVKSGKSVDNKKRVLSLAEQILQFVLSTDFTDFTDFATHRWGRDEGGCAYALSGPSGTSVVRLKYT